jgi:transcriptional regulator with XRE-family HTH domain
MQAFSISARNSCYTPAMPAGRPSQSKRSLFGERLFAARQQKGISQHEAADQMEIAQQTYASWERREVAIKPEDIAKLASILDTTVAYLLGCEEQSTRSNAPTGKLRRLVDEVRELPRYQQQRVIATLEDALLAQRAKKAS